MASFSIQVFSNLGNLTGFPPVKAIVGTAAVILESAYGAKQNRQLCLRVGALVRETMNNVYRELQSYDELPGPVVDALVRLGASLEQVQDFVERQSKVGFAHRVLNTNRNSEKQIRDELSAALSTFKLACAIHLHKQMIDMQKDRAEQEQKVLTAIDEYGIASQATADIIRPRLPPHPQLLIGRDNELQQIVEQIVSTDPSPARIAILGGGGIGKSTLALAALQDRDVITKFGDYRFFVSCESAESADGLVSELASHLGIYGDRLRKRLLHALAQRKLLIVLDNFETPWEDTQRRVDVEQFLGTLSGMSNLTLVVTMRGAERPLGTTWTKPTLEPLRPLDRLASLHVFSSLASLTSEEEESSQVKELLGLLDDIPLAVAITAKMVRNDGVAEVLRLWQSEGTSGIRSPVMQDSERLTSLDNSIQLSVDSSRVRKMPHAFELLQLLSLLPSGVPENFTHPGFPAIGKAVSALKSAMLVYTTDQGFIRMLCPIRTFMQKHHPPAYELIAPLEQHYVEVAQLCSKLGSSRTQELLAQLLAEWANVETLCGYMFDTSKSVEWSVSVVIDFDRLLEYTDMKPSTLFEQSLDLATSEELKLKHAIRRSARARGPAEKIAIATEALEASKALGNPQLEAECLFALGMGQRIGGMDAFRRAEQIFEENGNIRRQADTLSKIAQILYFVDDYAGALDVLEKAIELFSREDQIQGVVFCHHLKAQIYLMRGDGRTAAEVADRGIQLSEELPHSYTPALMIHAQAMVAQFNGDYTESLNRFLQARTLEHRYGAPVLVANQDACVAVTMCKLGEVVGARNIFDQASQEPSLGPWDKTTFALYEAEICRYEGDFVRGRELGFRALSEALKYNNSRMIGSIWETLAEIALDEADDQPERRDILAEEGLHYMIVATLMNNRAKNVRNMMWCASGLGHALLASRQYSEARGLLQYIAGWAKLRGAMSVYASCAVFLAHVEEESGSSEARTQAAWETAARAARAIKVPHLIAECERRVGFST